ncbi:hypothetical protein [Aminobacter aminovorans]|uniref:sunset domain-containing protein n=1 Tax=Aminobacter TaxID=31988 RepID=UPI0028650F28|nr:hypothetical protein [Aminobacter aminovorans]MDR7222300.1 hypothetical protein [Aminobacter aminovorans]
MNKPIKIALGATLGEVNRLKPRKPSRRRLVPRDPVVRLLTTLTLLSGTLVVYLAIDDSPTRLPRVHSFDLSSVPSAGHKPGCNIKGNINERGEQIYHMPGQSYYFETRVNLARGERWFCSQWEAWWAGWRKSKV